MSTPLSAAEWRILTANFCEALQVMRVEPPFNALEPCETRVFQAVLGALCLGSSSFRRSDIALHAGYSARSVRQALVDLKESDLLHVGSEDGQFDLGPRSTEFLRQFAFVRNPRIWRWRPVAMIAAPVTTPAATIATVPEAPAAIAAPPRAAVPEDSSAPAPVGAAISATLQRIRVSDAAPTSRAAAIAAPSDSPPSLIKKNKYLTSSSSSPEGGPTPDTVTTPATVTGQPVDAATPRRLALDALAAHFTRANPGIPLPRACDAADVHLVEACTAGGAWDADALRQAHLDAIEGAFEKATPERPPTPRYIWGQLRFFLAHAAVGRAKRLRAVAASKPKPPKPPEEPPASLEWVAEHMRGATAALEALPDVFAPKPRFTPRTWSNTHDQ